MQMHFHSYTFVAGSMVIPKTSRNESEYSYGIKVTMINFTSKIEIQKICKMSK